MQVFAWGANSHGQLGVGDKTDRNSPSYVAGLWALPVKQVTAGEFHSSALTANGQLYTWGSNEFGQLGIGSADETDSMVCLFSDSLEVELLYLWAFLKGCRSWNMKIYLVDSKKVHEKDGFRLNSKLVHNQEYGSY